ncbi:putative zinc finger protein [Apostasia shenzhenica]|uniref:Putative zinc finger protein n=1 Tax=Apostasia shenzhenica TaxID=1088818 RepID=A0A2H9ZXG7_9ASPA|nr:putative zinc finger protein [Apostasia shenzhenica]
MLNALEQKKIEMEEQEVEPEPTTEVLFLCSYEGCGKIFVDVGALKKHAHIHGERQYVCHFEGCGKKFLDSSKLKRHFLIHTGEKDYICPYEGCGKAFSLDFNLRAHMRTHSVENYHVCPYEDCGKRYTHEFKLKTHIKAHHEKDTIKHVSAANKQHSTPKASPAAYGSASSDRPYACTYEGCSKAYIHEYKLNLHLRKEHPGHISEENGKQVPSIDHVMDEASDQDVYLKKDSKGKNSKRSKPASLQHMPPLKSVNRKVLSDVILRNPNNTKKPWPVKETYEEDSEETEEDREQSENDDDDDDDDEETEDED